MCRPWSGIVVAVALGFSPLMTGCGSDDASSDSTTPSKPVKRTPREQFQLIASEINRRVRSFEGPVGSDMRIEFTVEEITKPVFHEPETEDGHLTAQMSIRTRSILTLADNSGAKEAQEGSSQTDDSAEEKDARDSGESNKKESEISDIAKHSVWSKYGNPKTETTDHLRFEFVDGRWTLASEGISELVLEVVNSALSKE